METGVGGRLQLETGRCTVASWWRVTAGTGAMEAAGGALEASRCGREAWRRRASAGVGAMEAAAAARGHLGFLFYHCSLPGGAPPTGIGLLRQLLFSD